MSSEIKEKLSHYGYIADDATAMAIYLSIMLNKPILVEGPAGVGKTEIAKMIAKILDTSLIRLQCYEGIDVYQAIYEWNYQAQIIHLKKQEIDGSKVNETDLYDERFLIKRPLLLSITQEIAPVLLIDEVDRADEEFESYLLELLSDWQISIPEKGTIPAKTKPIVVLTGNRNRDLSEALRRRCLYLWIDMPDMEKELAIIHKKLPLVNVKLAEDITKFMQALRSKELNKQPGIAETLDWASALAAMHFDHLDKTVIESTLGLILKDWEDIRNTKMSLSELMQTVGVISKI